ncbi:MAG: protein kinase [Myxococcota bacterium]
MDSSDTWKRRPKEAALELPARELPSADDVSGWCTELVERVQPGGLRSEPRSSDPGSGAAESGTELAGRYRLLYPIGSGGVGELWCAEHTGLGKQVALKLLRRYLARDPVVRRRFLREGRIATAVEHPGVVDVIDVGVAKNDRPYLVMELLEGRTLADEVRSCGPLSWLRAQQILTMIAEALRCAHEHGVIHRDLKPSNVMLLDGEPGERDRCKLIDFGMSKDRLLSEESTVLTQTGQVFGSPAYMSPEQFRGEEADERSDIYSLGCVTFFVLQGRRPFDGQTPAELMYQHLMSPLPRLVGVDAPARVRGALQRLLRTACHKDRHQRFASMDALLEALAGIERPRPRWWSSRVSAAALGVSMVGAVVAVTGRPGELTGQDAPSDPGERAEPVASAERSVLEQRAASSEPIEQTTSAVHSLLPDSVVDVRAGAGFTCVLTTRGLVRCWGRQADPLCQPQHAGNIGDDELPYAVPALDFGEGRSARQLGLSFFSGHACALLDDGSVRCWGNDDQGQLGLGPGVTDWCDSPEETLAALPPLLPQRAAEIHVQSANTCAVVPDDAGIRRVYCWGDNSHGQLGQGHLESLDRPPERPIDLGGASVEQLSVGVHHVCARLDSGAVRCWGGNGYLQLGNGWSADHFVGDGHGNGTTGAVPSDPSLDVRGLEDFEVAVVRSNGGWTCVLGTMGAVRCWGANTNGALGYRYDQIPDCTHTANGTHCRMPWPRDDVDLGDLGGARIIDLQLGRRRACVLDDVGAVRCWGWGDRGGLGYGSALREATGYEGIGHHQTPAEAYAAMHRSGRHEGRNAGPSAGVVDIGDFDGDGAIDRVVQLTMGNSHACVLVEDGTVRCWGSGSDGQLGYGTVDDIGDDETPAEYYAAHGCGAVPVFAGQGC